MKKPSQARPLPPDRVVEHRGVEGGLGDLRYAVGMTVRTLEPRRTPGAAGEPPAAPLLARLERGTPGDIQRWEWEGGAVRA